MHRTFQEYLAAKEIAEENYIDVLAEHATRDMWRETVVMTAGLANSEYRKRLVDRLLDRAESGSTSRARWLRLLAGACVETAPALAVDTLDRIDASLVELVPPRNAAEARSLALGGERVIRFLPDDLGGLSENAAAAVVDTAAFVGGSAALRKLGGYGHDPRYGVVQALIRAASHFEPDEYGQQVLAESPLRDGWMPVDEWTIAVLPHLRKLYGVECDQVSSEIIEGIPPVRGLRLFGRLPDRLDFLRSHPELERLALHWPTPPEELPPTLTRLSQLDLRLPDPKGVAQDLDWVTRFPQLTSLYLTGLEKTRSLRPLTGLRNLTALGLAARGQRRILGDLRFLSRLPRLDELWFSDCADARDVERIAAAQPHLTSLGLLNLRTVAKLDLTSLAGLPLDYLSLYGYRTPLDLRPLAGHPTLQTLDLGGCKGLDDVSPLATIPGLALVRLDDVPELDLAPLAGNRRLVVWAKAGQPFRNAAGVRFKR